MNAFDEEAIREDERRRCAAACKALEHEKNALYKAAVLAGDLWKARELNGEVWGAGCAAQRVLHRERYEERE